MLGDLFIGCAVAGIIIPAQTLMQQETPPELMGRVGSTFMSCVFTAQILGLLLPASTGPVHQRPRRLRALRRMLVLLAPANSSWNRNLWMEPKSPIAQPAQCWLS
jgi:DHA3 family macrolide efflux protein-like MFS transporter